jgi:hypothetical protein
MSETNQGRIDRADRRQLFNKLAAEDLTRIEKQTIERMSLITGNPLTEERIKQTIFRASEVFGLYGMTLPRGYKVLGNGHVGGKTPNYLAMADGNRASGATLVADAMSGWLDEVAELLESRLTPLRRANAAPETLAGESEAVDGN